MYTTSKGIHMGQRVNLIGILYAGPQHTTTGEIVFENISTNPKAILKIPNNLSVVIKANRIKELEKKMKEDK